jgi:hypothetical protein
MRKQLMSLGLLIVVGTVGAMSVNAQSSVTLGTAASSTVTFTPGMSSTTMGVAATSGPAGFPSGPLLTTVTAWDIDPGSVTITPALAAAGLYTVSGTLAFELNGGSFLTGLLSFPLDAHLAGDELTLNAFLTIDPLLSSICTTSPSVCAMGAKNTVQLSVALDGDHDFGRFLSGNVTIGPVSSLVTPEPGTMLLFGTGLLALGAVLRRRLRPAVPVEA